MKARQTNNSLVEFLTADNHYRPDKDHAEA